MSRYEYLDYPSSESSFYGDEDTKDRFTLLAQTLETSMLNLSGPDPNTISREAHQHTELQNTTRHNPHEGDANAWQLNESAADFVNRIPPSTTTRSDAGPWLWCANPFYKKPEARNDIAGFCEAVSPMLSAFLEDKAKIEKERKGKSAATISKKVGVRRREAENALLEEAGKANVLTGKWMLFPVPQDVDAVWEAVVDLTITGQLGVTAKVATDHGRGEKSARVICVYTKDFRDKNDNERVVRELKARSLFSGVIYYKCDAFTHADIQSGNQYGIKASLYSSKEIMADKARAKS